MAKGENLEKPKKKGGMVIVIGMGAKPKKDSMKKAFGRGSDDAKLSSRAKTLRRFKSGRKKIDDALERRKVDPEEFHGEFLRRHGMNFEDYLADGSAKIDPQALIDELAEKRFGAAKKTAVKDGLLNTEKFKGLLRNQNISEREWKRAVGKIKDSDLTRNTFSELVQRLGNPNDDATPPQSYNQIFQEYDRANAGEYDYDELEDADAQDRRAEEGEPPKDSDEESRALRFYERLFSHLPNPTQVALQQLGRGTVRDQNRQDIEDEFKEGLTPDTTPSSVFTQRNVAPGFRAGSPDEDEDPNVGFDAQSIGATTPKTMTANPRELGPLSRPREGQGEERIVRPFRMQTSFDDPKNVMNAAWALLKGNPSMRDAEGRAINHPAAMVYDDLATQVHLNEIGPNDFIDDPDDETAADRMEQMRNPTHQKKLLRRLKQGKHASMFDAKMAARNDQAEQNRLRQMREEARGQTRNTMEFGNEDDSPSPNYGIQQSTGTDVRMKPSNIMDQM